MSALRREDGFSLVELLVSMMGAIVVMSGIVVVMTTALHQQSRIADRVEANQRVRPVMTRMVQQLHSACVAQHVVPVIADGTSSGPNASSSNQITFLTKSSTAATPIAQQVTPTPEKHVITLSGSTLTESVYLATAGSQPGPWTFSGSPSSTRQVLTDVSAPSGGMFKYYRFTNGALSTTPEAVPLTAAAAPFVSIVDIGMVAAPNGGASSLDTKSPITLNDSVDLRLENAGQYPNQENQPCV
jgi:type II secretory pathway pseudopilin PulG